jgi:hypothetical protein
MSTVIHPIPVAVPTPNPGLQTSESPSAFASVLEIASEKFFQELPQLLRDFPNHWVAYNANGRIGEPTKTVIELYAAIKEQQTAIGSYVIRQINPWQSTTLEVSPDVTY